MTATVAASAMAGLDATVVNIALPHIGTELHADISTLQWVLTGYLLSLASLILLGGALGDRIGRRKVFVIGTVWFALASALCGASPTIYVLIAARILQGVGGALLTPGSLAILQASFQKSDRAAAIGAWSGLGGAAGAIGPFIGGAVVDGPGWRWAFLINVPVAALAVGAAWVSVPETRDLHASGRLDYTGAALAVVGLFSGTWALIEAGRRHASAGLVTAATIVSVAGIGGFVRHVRHADAPLVPPRLFRNRTFTVVNLMTVTLYAAIGVTPFLVAYQLEVAAGWSALRAGAALLPTTVLMLVLSARSGRLAQRIGPRLQLSLGPLVTGAGLVMLTRIGPHPDWSSDVLPGSVVFGLGLAIFVAPLTATVMGAANPEEVNVASAVNNAVARAAGLAALAVIPVITGLTTSVGPVDVTHAYRLSCAIAAALALLAGPLAFVELASTTRAPTSARRLHCAIDGPPLQPDPTRCPTGR